MLYYVYIMYIVYILCKYYVYSVYILCIYIYYTHIIKLYVRYYIHSIVYFPIKREWSFMKSQGLPKGSLGKKQTCVADSHNQNKQAKFTTNHYHTDTAPYLAIYYNS